MKSLFCVTALMIAALLTASEAKACFDCCVPPPYTRPMCCSSVCGSVTCTTTSGTSTFCSGDGGPCSSNDAYCGDGDGGVQHKTDWVRCTPPLAHRWQLVAVRITPPAAKSVRRS